MYLPNEKHLFLAPSTYVLLTILSCLLLFFVSNSFFLLCFSVYYLWMLRKESSTILVVFQIFCFLLGLFCFFFPQFLWIERIVLFCDTMILFQKKLDQTQREIFLEKLSSSFLKEKHSLTLRLLPKMFSLFKTLYRSYRFLGDSMMVSIQKSLGGIRYERKREEDAYLLRLYRKSRHRFSLLQENFSFLDGKLLFQNIVILFLVWFFRR